MTLEGKVALVTGSSKGIGAAIAERLAREGASVVVNGRELQSAEAVAARIGARGGVAAAVQADLSEPADIKHLFATIQARFGRLDILVNNTSVNIPGTLDEITPEAIDRACAVNIRVTLLATQAAVRLFPADAGVVINISSGAARTPLPMAHVYCATKGAVDVFTRSLAMELGQKGTRVVAVAPGFTDTGRVANIDDRRKAEIVRPTPLGHPADVAAVVALLASDDAGWITGETIQAGGGLRL